MSVRMLGEQSEAEDAVQEAFIAAYRNMDRLRGDDPFPWLVRITTNACLQLLRTRRRKGTAHLAEPDLVVDERPASERSLAMRNLLEHVVGELDERGQQILVTHFIHGMDQSEVATALGISRRAVAKRLTRMRERYLPMMRELGVTS